MKKILSYMLVGAALLCLGCNGEDDLTPQVDTSSIYEKYIVENATRSSADSTIYEWYKKYNTAFIYNFTDDDIRWMWASKLAIRYTPFDIERTDMILKQLNLIKTSFLDKYDEDFLRKNLPYKVFLVKDLQSMEGSLSYSYVSAMTNNQDAILVAYLQSTGRAYSASTLETDLGNCFGMFFYNRLEVKPTKFINSRVKLNYNLVTTPQDPNIEEELKIRPNFSNTDHYAMVCGFVKAYLPTHVKEPTEVQDFTDYLTFITQNKGSYIRQRTQFYKRVAKRGTYFIEYYRDALGQDLIAMQNAKFPDDPVTMADFNFQ